MSLLFRVFASRGIYRRKMGTGGLVGPAHHSSARPHPGSRPPMAWGPGVPPQVPSGLRDLFDLLFMAELISFDSEDISCVGFLKRKTAENRELALWHVVNRFVPENA